MPWLKLNDTPTGTASPVSNRSETSPWGNITPAPTSTDTGPI